MLHSRTFSNNRSLPDEDRYTFQLHLHGKQLTAFETITVEIIVPHTFRKAGVVDVQCNIHWWMEMQILVVPNAWYAVTDASARFTLDLPIERTP